VVSSQADLVLKYKVELSAGRGKGSNFSVASAGLLVSAVQAATRSMPDSMVKAGFNLPVC
jgi:hypothetical protein